MSCAECRATFVALDEAVDPEKSRAVRLDEAQPECRCQAVSVSAFSSGPVKDEETLIRILVAPQHVDKKGRPRAAALSDAERGGLSVFRDAQAKDEEIRTVAEGLVSKARSTNGAKAGVFGVLLMQCAIVRSCRGESDDAACYCIYDTALPDSPGHAETFQRVSDVAEPVREDRRRVLFGLVKERFIPVGQFRNGLLLDLAPQAP